MIRLKTIIISTIVGFLVFSSCIKEPEEESQEQDLSCLLTSFSGDEFAWSFSYDNKRKLKRATYSNNDGVYNTYDMIYTDGKISEIRQYRNGSEGFIEYLYYNGDNLTMREYYEKNEFDSWYTETIYEYTYDSQGQVKKRDRYYDANDGNGLIFRGYLNFTWQNGNVTKIENHDNNKKSATIDHKYLIDPYKSIYNLKSTNDQIYTQYIEYDNKPNATASLGMFFIINFSKNNITKQTYNYNDGFYYSYSSNYSYNQEGFPEYCTETLEIEGEIDETYSEEYFYTYQCD